MGYKNVCLDCRKAFNQGTDYNNIRPTTCPECGKLMIQVNQKFRPPKKDDLKNWKIVDLLIRNGFTYHTLYGENYQQIHEYPKSYKEAEDFVIKYKSKFLRYGN